MGLFDIFEKIHDILEDVSAKGGKNITSFTNATMNSNRGPVRKMRIYNAKKFS